MKSGIATSVCEVTGINDLGFWVLAGDCEYFVPFSAYPEFKESSVNQILNIRFFPPSQLSWIELDIDIELPSLSKPESFPLAFKK